MILVVSQVAAADASWHVAQARQFWKNGWVEDALSEIEAAIATPEGKELFEAWWLGAEISVEEMRIRDAEHYLKGALKAFKNPEQQELAQQLQFYLEASIGFVLVEAPYEGMSSRFQVESTSPILDPELKRRTESYLTRLRDKTALPIELALPVGSWKINGVSVTVVANQQAKLKLSADQLGVRGLAALQVPRLELEGGMFLVPTGQAAGWGPTAGLTLTIPTWLVFAGPWVGWAAQGPWCSNYGSMEYTAVEGGFKVGGEGVLGGPFSIRPSIGLGLMRFPGVSLSCTKNGSCVGVGTADGVKIRVPSLAAAPTLELDVEYQKSGRTKAMAVGIGLEARLLLGRVAEAGEEKGFAWTSISRSWTGIGLHPSLYLGFVL
jgi:hypothetical protein